MGIDNVIVCGYASEFCVDTTVRRAAGLELFGYVDIGRSYSHMINRTLPALKFEHIIMQHCPIFRALV
ncbi:isochorismatase family protein [Vibrio sp. PP-XX7]